MKCCRCHKEDSVGHGVHFWYFKSEVVLCEDCYEKYGVERMVFEHKFLTDALDSQWIPITFRPMDDEEYEECIKHGDCPREECKVYNCRMPEDGQEVLITTSWGTICIDIYHIDVDSCFFEDHDDSDDVIAWMPLPKPFEAEVQDGN